jgi:hypothetical protein
MDLAWCTFDETINCANAGKYRSWCLLSVDVTFPLPAVESLLHRQAPTYYDWYSGNASSGALTFLMLRHALRLVIFS